MAKMSISGPGGGRAPEGLRNGGHVILSCSNCKAGLMDLWITNPDAVDSFTKKPFNWRVKASCPWCGDESFVTNVVGVFHPGGFGLPNPKDEDDVLASTIWTGEFDELPGGVIFYKVIKASADAKPMRAKK